LVSKRIQTPIIEFCRSARLLALHVLCAILITKACNQPELLGHDGHRAAFLPV
jgi:hypothetical protein